MLQARKKLLPIILITGSLFVASQGRGAQAAKASYASEILKDVREDKVYLLENIRRKVTKPSEKTLIEALLTEDGPKAASLYRKQLSKYPDPELDPVSRERLAAYDRAAGSTSRPVMNAPKQPAQASPVAVVPAPATTGRTPDSVARLATAPSVKKADSVARMAKPPVQKSAPAATTPAASQTPANTAKSPSPTAPGPVAAGSYTLQFGSFDSVSNADQLAAQLAQSSPATVVEVNGVYKVRLKRSFASREEASKFGHTLPIESFVVNVKP
jgi:cell division protein FtsN